jgi:hypothetical protein
MTDIHHSRDSFFPSEANKNSISNLHRSKDINRSTSRGKILRTDQETKRDEQNRQMLRIAGAEIDELKDSLKYAEYLLARTKEEKENMER